MSKAKPARYTSSSKMGRQIMAQTPVRESQSISKEMQIWNEQVDAKKAKKIAQKRTL